MGFSTRFRLPHPGGVLVLLGVFCGLVIGALVLWAARVDRQAAVEAIALESDGAALALEERTRHVIEVAGLECDALAKRIAVSGVVAITTPDLTKLLEDHPILSNIFVVDDRGRVLMQGRGANSAVLDFSQADWVGALAGGATTFVGAQAQDLSGYGMAFPVACRAGGAGSFLVAMTVDGSAAYQSLAKVLDADRQPVMGVARQDGAAMMVQSWGGDAPEPRFSVAELTGDSGRFVDRDNADGVTRHVSYRRSQDLGLLVWVGESPAAKLDDWMWRSTVVVVIALLSLVVLAAGAVRLNARLLAEHRDLDRLSSMNRNLERSNADLEQFACMASHDLKEPLRNVASYVQLLQRRYQGQLDADADAFIGYAVEGVRRLQAIIDDLLTYARSGSGPLRLAPVQTGALVSAALTHLREHIGIAQAAIEVQGPLPVVEADAGLLSSLFQNLIGNAVKYRRPEARPEITIGCQDQGEDWRFFVQDNGIGIDPAHSAQIFQLFTRLHPKDRYPGTGIGLAMCQKAVERHGGAIWVESSPGQGATFFFTLPKRQKGA